MSPAQSVEPMYQARQTPIHEEGSKGKWILDLLPRLATPMKQSNNSLMTCTMLDTLMNILQIHRMLLGIFGHTVLMLCERAHYTESACCRIVGAN
jgi:hypothetical protein